MVRVNIIGRFESHSVDMSKLCYRLFRVITEIDQIYGLKMLHLSSGSIVCYGVIWVWCDMMWWYAGVMVYCGIVIPVRPWKASHCLSKTNAVVFSVKHCVISGNEFSPQNPDWTSGRWKVQLSEGHSADVLPKLWLLLMWRRWWRKEMLDGIL